MPGGAPEVIEKLRRNLIPTEALEAVDRGFRLAAVTLIIYGLDGDLKVILAERKEDLSRHPGEVGLPGGASEERDRDLLETALRETREEIGTELAEEDVIGGLSPVEIPVSNFRVYPFVVYLDEEPVLEPDESEVVSVIHLSLDDVTKPDAFSTQTFSSSDGGSVELPYMPHGEHRVWGATARILSDLRERLLDDRA